MRDDDAFWAARRVAAFSDELIRAAVHTGQFSDPAAEQYLGDVLIKRRDKIARTYLTAINPIVDPRLDANGRLTFGNAAFAAGVANGAATYHAAWMRFDNATGETSPLGGDAERDASIDAPRSLPAAPDSYIQVDLSVDSEGHPTWRRPIRTWFRRERRRLDAGRSRTAARNGVTRACVAQSGAVIGPALTVVLCGVAAAAIVRGAPSKPTRSTPVESRATGIKPVERRRRRLGEGPVRLPDYDAYWKQTKMTASAHAEWPSTHSSGT